MKKEELQEMLEYSNGVRSIIDGLINLACIDTEYKLGQKFILCYGCSNEEFNEVMGKYIENWGKADEGFYHFMGRQIKFLKDTEYNYFILK